VLHRVLRGVREVFLQSGLVLVRRGVGQQVLRAGLQVEVLERLEGLLAAERASAQDERDERDEPRTSETKSKGQSQNDTWNRHMRSMRMSGGKERMKMNSIWIGATRLTLRAASAKAGRRNAP
jgi:hypothetical protein